MRSDQIDALVAVVFRDVHGDARKDVDSPIESEDEFAGKAWKTRTSQASPAFQCTD